MKKIVSNCLHQFFLRLVWWIVRVLFFTYKYEFSESKDSKSIIEKGGFIMAVWHHDVIGFLSAHAWTHPYLTLASRSKDGDFAAYISSKMGFIPVRGSSKKKNVDKGGKDAIDEYIQKIGLGMRAGITVDGPKGPRHVCKIGIAKIAQQTGCPILPGVATASRYWTINSWDKFIIPKPFCKITVTYGNPIWVDKEASHDDLVEVCHQVEKRLTAAASRQ